MELPESIKRFKHPISLTLAILVVTGSFFAGWFLTVLAPIFVFLVFKLLYVWKTKERLALGITALIIGTLLFFFIFSYQVSDVEMQKFTSGGMEITIKPYSSMDFNKSATIQVVVPMATNSTLYYEVNSTATKQAIEKGYVNGTISGNVTRYIFNVSMSEGIYFVKFVVDERVGYGEIIRETPNKLFNYFLTSSGGYVIGLLIILYVLFVFGIHLVRKNKELMSLRYEQQKRGR